MGNLGFPELLLILVIMVFVFGANRIGDIGKGMGEAVRGFKKALHGDDEDDRPPSPKDPE
jgi:sec-independent protein translocase protein TatA